ncbi:MAG: CBS domain-containing protein, partial [Gemmatimonadetes bacterium]|nr:CBS domain-containing protein [Gemmatimonadota bacterium]NIQ54953.1 CBS domain-containing protein [Gemmatimonadota bacterium]NIU75154.1 CBS domain-containing protein [Gammaproteobacteria bacterium]NIX44979.1 CBS domain-containing protein [Gemmatimonadota bacterium]NIY09209.1 CBS domain-containing protein [Gemmatimonadota bacterium]
MPDRSTTPAAPADHLEFIRGHPPFDGLDEEALACVVESAELLYLPRGERVLRQGGEPSRHMYLIRKGAVRLERDGQVAIVLEEGDLFGFPSLTSGEPPAFDVITDEETLVYRLTDAPCADMVQGSGWTEFLVQGLQERLRRTAAREGAGAESGLSEPVKGLVQRPPVWLEGTDTVRSAALLMRDEGVSSVLVASDPPGILTDRDLRNRVLANGLGPGSPLAEVASRPVLTLPGDAPIHEAVAFMLRNQIHHLPVTEDGEIAGVVTNGDLLRHRSQSPLHLGRRLSKLDSQKAADGYSADVAVIVERMFDQGVEALRIGRLIAGLNDTLIRGALRLAEAELGPPPRPYEWIVFGSEGRMEQTLLTDQDNALIWEDGDGDAGGYFHTLASHVVGTLLHAGFPRCAGGYMATNWAFPLAEWEERFRSWIRLDEPRALVDAANFFDFRGVRGILSLDPLSELLDRAGRQQIFLAHLAAASTRFRPPLGLFGRLKDHDGTVDLKGEGIMPVVGLARVHA